MRSTPKSAEGDVEVLEMENLSPPNKPKHSLINANKALTYKQKRGLFGPICFAGDWWLSHRLFILF